MSHSILVTCSLGQLVIESLLAQNIFAKNIFAQCRDPEKPAANAFETNGVTVRQADFTDVNSMVKAMTGIHTLMFISSGSWAKRFEQHVNVINAAKTVGVRHIVYTSFLKCSNNSKFLVSPDHVRTEEALKDSGIPYTIFRNSIYMDLLPYMLGIALSSERWSYPVGKAKVNFVAKNDIAEGLAKVLMNSGAHLNKTYEIVSGKSYSFDEIAPIMSISTGKPILYDPVSIDQFKTHLEGSGMSEVDVEFNVSLAIAIAAGQVDCIDLTLEKILGRNTKTMEEYLPIISKA